MHVFCERKYVHMSADIPTVAVHGNYTANCRRQGMYQWSNAISNGRRLVRVNDGRCKGIPGAQGGVEDTLLREAPAF